MIVLRNILCERQGWIRWADVFGIIFWVVLNNETAPGDWDETHSLRKSCLVLAPKNLNHL